MILGDIDTYMSATDYIGKAKEKDVAYANYVERSLSFVEHQLSTLNSELLRNNREEYKPEIRIKNSTIINSEVSLYAFYINSETFMSCYKMNISKYKDVFINEYIQNILLYNPIEFPFSFIINHELSHIYRAHNDVKNSDINKSLFVKATEMDADLIAVSSLYRAFQSSMAGKVDDEEIRCLVLISALEAFYAMSSHSNGTIYQSELERLWDVICKISILNESTDIKAPVDVNFTSELSKKNSQYILDFLFKSLNILGANDCISKFINKFFEYVIKPTDSETAINAWHQIKSSVSEVSKTTV
jgi:hypothetical protein